MEIKYKKLIPEAKAPLKMIEVDAGFDLYATSIVETPDYIEYKTGLAFEIPVGYAGLIFPRSSVTKYDLMLKNSIGLIDASYRGEIVCRFKKIIGEEVKDFILFKKPINDIPKNILKRLKNILKINQSLPRENIFIDFSNAKIYEVGERVAQIVFIEIPKITLVEATKLSETDRGSGGFGSTGK